MPPNSRIASAAQVRAADPGDAEAIVGLTAAGWRAAYPGIVPDELIRNLPISAWRHDIGTGLRAPVADAFTRLAEVDGAPVGYCYIAAPGREELEGSEVAELVAIYVDSAHWRRGVGRALLESAQGEAGLLDYREMLLWTFEPNASARAFYLALGFADDGGRRPHEASGTPTVRMRRTLDHRFGPSQ